MSNRGDYLFASESVSEGHPDKVCDRISDAVLDAFLAEHAESRVACETFATTDRVVVGGEVRGPEGVLGRIEDIVRQCVRDIGYAQKGFNWETLHVDNLIHGQSVHIAQGVDAADGKEEGAGDQGIMFGYAVDETPELMPAPIHYAHAILRRLSEVRRSGAEKRLGPDAKSQISLRYAGGRPVEVTSLVLSTQHLDEDMTSADVREMVEPHIRAVLPEGWLTERTVWHVNPTGKFVIGGPDGDAGPDRAQDHRRHLRRRGAARRRRLLGQGPDQGRPLRGLRRALPRQERGGGRAGAALRDPALLRHRGGAAALDLRRLLRHRRGTRRRRSRRRSRR